MIDKLLGSTSGLLIWWCLEGLSLAYLHKLYFPTPGTIGRSSLCYVEQGMLLVHFTRKWSAPLCGMDRCLSIGDCSSGSILTNSTLALKLFFLAVVISEARLSSKLKRCYINLQNELTNNIGHSTNNCSSMKGSDSLRWRSIFRLIFWSLCAHEISFVQHITRTSIFCAV